MQDNIFNSVEEAVKQLKLDRRHKWFEMGGQVFYNHRFTSPCSGCSCDCSDGNGCSHGNAGCRECGYKGRVRDGVPVPAWTKEGDFVLIRETEFTKDDLYNKGFGQHFTSDPQQRGSSQVFTLGNLKIHQVNENVNDFITEGEDGEFIPVKTIEQLEKLISNAT